MKLSGAREAFLKPLQAVIGVVERRQTMPILANILIVAKRDGNVSFTATDLEVELVAGAQLSVDREGEVTVPARKLLDICRALPDEAKVTVALDGEKLSVKSGRSRFTLSTLPASEFPTVDEIEGGQSVDLAQSDAKRLLEKTHFAMAQQDVRYYLNGLLLEADGRVLRAVATDGHRLALCEVETQSDSAQQRQVIVPRKGVLELQRLLGDEGNVTMAIGSNHIRVEVGDIRFTSKLVDGRFPEYGRVIPRGQSYKLTADRNLLRQALHRTAILSNEKYRGIRLEVKENGVVIQAHNPEQEEAEEQIEVEYHDEPLEIGFNVNYLLDALGAIDSEQVEVGLTDGSSSCLISEPSSDRYKYVVMPMRL
ncbi:MAG: DNA polymerase III subunit beta [Gammaproteobacteria bacterium]|nr:DNA polymerase III subunit beta [Gammaproteobacteria bacterium]